MSFNKQRAAARLLVLCISLMATSVFAQVASPTLLSPADRTEVTTNRPTFKWLKPSGATTYQINVRKLVNNVYQDEYTLTRNTTTSIVSYRPHHTLTHLINNANTSYAWRVRAGNSGGYGNWSSFRYFDVNTQLDTPVTYNTPSVITYLPYKLNWYTVSGATSYDVEVKELVNGTYQPYIFENVSPSYYDGHFDYRITPNNVGYAWRVRARNSSNISAWSLYQYFDVDAFDIELPPFKKAMDKQEVQLTPQRELYTAALNEALAENISLAASKHPLLKALGQPTGEVEQDGDLLVRSFEHGELVVNLGGTTDVEIATKATMVSTLGPENLLLEDGFVIGNLKAEGVWLLMH